VAYFSRKLTSPARIDELIDELNDVKFLTKIDLVWMKGRVGQSGMEGY
jgi:hypothetical protein